MCPLRERFGLASRVLVLIAALGLGMGAAPAFAELDLGPPPEVGVLKSELEKMKTALDSITKELEILKQLVSQRPSLAPQPQEAMAHVGTSGNPILGSPEAPLTLIEFSDYQCPYCRQFFEATLPALKAEYIDTGKLRYVFRDFPLDRIHPQARKAAEAAHCAGDQGQYWAMRDMLFHHQQALQREQLQVYAHHLGLDSGAFAACLEEGKYVSKVQKDVEDGTAVGVRGTPAFFLGKTGADGTMQGVAISGARPITAFRHVIERLLDGK